MTVRIITNNHIRPIVYGYELTDNERSEFDWLDDLDFELASFFRYKGNVYALADFMRIDAYGPTEFKKWDGYMNDSFFSGILVRYAEDTDFVIVGWYLS